MGRLDLNAGRRIFAGGIVAVALVAALLGILAATSPLVALFATTAALAATVAVVRPALAPGGLLLLGLILYIWPVSSVNVAGMDPRLIALGSFLLAAILSGSLGDIQPSLKDRGVQAHLALMVAAVSSIAWSEQVTQTGITALGSVAGWVAVLLVASVLGKSKKMDASLRIAAIIGIAMNAAVWLAPGGVPDSYAGGRFTGIFANANGLGLFLAFAIAVLAFQPRLWRFSLLLAIPMLVATGSRSSALAAIVAVLVPNLVARRAGIARRLLAGMAFLLFTLGIIWVLRTPERGELPSMLRSTDSRTEYWAAAWERFLDSPLYGKGFGAEDEFFSVNSHLLLASELGVIGLALVVILLGLLWRLLRRPDTPPYIAALVAAGVINSVFESWLYRGGSPYYVMFWSAVIASSVYSQDACTQQHVQQGATARPLLGAAGTLS